MACLLNKTMGCDSPTVPPLYVPRDVLRAKAGHWEFPGKAEHLAKEYATLFERHKSEDLRIASLPSSACITEDAFVTEKRPWRHFVTPRHYFRVKRQIQTRLKAADFGAFHPIVPRNAQSIPSPQ